jgi:hypothetical protein
MQIKPLLLFIILAFFSLSAHQSAGQCLADSKIEVVKQDRGSSIQIIFERNAKGVIVEVKDIMDDSQTKGQVTNFDEVVKNRSYEIASRLKDSLYAVVIAAKDCEGKLATVKIHRVGNSEDPDSDE